MTANPSLSTNGSPHSSAEKALQRRRIISLIASTLISLAAGTNYVYSAYAPQLASSLHLTASQTSLIGTFGNLGMYLMGIPSGLIVDHRGPRIPILLGGLCLLLGYYPLHLAMARGEGSFSVAALCAFSGLTGVGSCFAFGGALKTAAVNWPRARGAATGTALAAFGLSAVFWAGLGRAAGWGGEAGFLYLLAVGTSGICLVGYWFCKIVPVSVSGYQSIAVEEDGVVESGRMRLHRTRSSSSAKSGRPLFTGNGDDIGTPTFSTFADAAAAGSASSSTFTSSLPPPNVDPDAQETSSLFSRSSDESVDSERRRDLEAARHDRTVDTPPSSSSDISGWSLFTSSDFWILFIIMGALAGVGLMTINNIGSNVHLLFAPLNPIIPADEITAAQSFQVSLISLSSFASRIASGTLSDRLSAQSMPRHICLLISALLAIVATASGMFITNPYHLSLLSVMTGLSYGTLFGVAPTIVSETFGVSKMSTNWGALTIGAVVGGNVGNLWYGTVVDHHAGHSEPGEGGPSDGMGHGGCFEGVECYKGAYEVGLVMAVVGAVSAGWAVWKYSLGRREDRRRAKSIG